ncbi:MULTISPECIES: N-acyl homoserine lactonase [Xenorhabdus]|uniref:N-acyl homoserine lactonase n=1 Tax=Xenorhabdus TaxID=626 RepID=UPI001E29C327|nr:N-acyl homoserine lactonase [Xenorhabdus sp. PB30.3]MCC8380357.1 N-acyl homoserine lactonase [Xenorhabdus sp. PB30.3]
MNKIIIFIVSFLLGLQISFAEVNSEQYKSDQDIAEKLTQRYNDSRKDCGGKDLPAFLCSGIILRGTKHSDQYRAWDPSPHSRQSGGVSFSYLRTDSKLFTLDADYQNGFIFSPYLKLLGKTKPEVLCYFPTDADSFDRTGKGCGQFRDSPQSKPCQSQGITTAKQWIEHYHSGLSDKTYQCGFDVRMKPGRNPADAFIQGVQARLQLSFKTNNEFILATWPQHIPYELPIEAFFYLSKGLKGAQYDQKDFYKDTGKIIPIIKIELPSDYTKEATFTYSQEDQVVHD